MSSIDHVFLALQASQLLQTPMSAFEQKAGIQPKIFAVYKRF